MILKREIVLKTSEGLKLELKLEITAAGYFMAGAVLRRATRAHNFRTLCFIAARDRRDIRVEAGRFSAVGENDLWIASTCITIDDRQAARVARFLTQWDELTATPVPTVATGVAG